MSLLTHIGAAMAGGAIGVLLMCLLIAGRDNKHE